MPNRSLRPSAFSSDPKHGWEKPDEQAAVVFAVGEMELDAAFLEIDEVSGD